MKVSNSPITDQINSNGGKTLDSWSTFFTEVSDALQGEFDYTNRNSVSAGVNPPNRIIVCKQGYLIYFLIEWDSDQNLGGGTLTFTDKSLTMRKGNLIIIDGSTLTTETALCENDVITLPSFTSSNGSIRIQGTILTKKILKEV